MFNKSALQRISGRGETWMRKMPELSAAKLQLQLKHSQIFRNVHLQIFHKNEMQFTAFNTPTDFTYIVLKATGKFKGLYECEYWCLTGDSADFNAWGSKNAQN